MGKALKRKAAEAEHKTAQLLATFAAESRRVEAKAKAAPPPLINEFWEFSKEFIRSPDTFVLKTRSANRDKQKLEMARHLFQKFKVPKVLDQVWVAKTPTLMQFWYICVAQGGSLYKHYTKGMLTKKETHTFLSAPESLNTREAVFYSVAVCAGASNGMALRIARSKISEQEGRVMSQLFEPFWFDVVRFFCLPDHMPESIAAINDLVDYLADQYRQSRGTYRLLGTGQSLAGLKRRVEEWHRALARMKSLDGARWDGSEVNDFEITQKHLMKEHGEITWQVRQIKTGKELAAEGSAQRHCVLSYKPRCLAGSCSIWSLTRSETYGEKKRCVTIEMNSRNEIVQMRGLANRKARSDEIHIVTGG